MPWSCCCISWFEKLVCSEIKQNDLNKRVVPIALYFPPYTSPSRSTNKCVNSSSEYWCYWIRGLADFFGVVTRISRPSQIWVTTCQSCIGRFPTRNPLTCRSRRTALIGAIPPLATIGADILLPPGKQCFIKFNNSSRNVVNPYCFS